MVRQKSCILAVPSVEDAAMLTVVLALQRTWKRYAARVNLGECWRCIARATHLRANATALDSSVRRRPERRGGTSRQHVLTNLLSRARR